MPRIYAALPSELAWLVSEAAVAGWNRGLRDSYLFWQLAPAGFLSLELQGRFAEGGAVVRHSDQYGFMELSIMDQQHRGKGPGKILCWARRDYLVGRLTPGAATGLDAVDTMVHFYEQGCRTFSAASGHTSGHRREFTVTGCLA